MTTDPRKLVVHAANQKTAGLQKQIDAINSASVMAFSSYITDQTISLKDRWELFINYSEHHIHHGWIIDIKSKAMEWIFRNWFDAPEIYGRGKRIDIVDMVNDNIAYAYLHDDQSPILDGSDDEGLSCVHVMEELMLSRTGSFNYDW